MDVIIKGQNKKITLDRTCFLASGGEGDIYVKRGTAFKIYQDPKKMIPYAKIQELALIKDSNVIRPQNLLMNNSNRPIGYTTKFIDNVYVLCQLFPKGFRDREGLDNDQILKLVLRLREMIENIHKAQILVVDLNEMNYLVSKDFSDIFAIDTDSYQTPSFPATAIMESIRDWQTNGFNVLTDWYSFGVISFQMFVGIHPFKGRYSNIYYPKDKMRELKERMLAKIPVFHKDVNYPNNVLPFDTIPSTFKEWYKSLFFQGQRIPAPADAVEVIIVPTLIPQTMGDKDFDIKEIFMHDDIVIYFLSLFGNKVTILKNGDILLNNIKKINVDSSYIAITAKNNSVICGKIKKGVVKLWNVETQEEIECSINAESMMSYQGRIYVKSGDTIQEIQFFEYGDKIQPVPKQVANVMTHATQFFNGMAAQNVLGTFVADIFPDEGMHYPISIKEMKGYKIIDAKYDNQILIVIGSQQGQYDKFTFKFDKDFSSYSVVKVKDITYTGINFTVLDNGVVVHINEDEEIEIFSNKKDSTTVKVLHSNVIDGDMKLFCDGAKVLFSKDKKLHSLSMHK